MDEAKAADLEKQFAETIERHRALGVEDEPEKKVVEDMDVDLDDLNFDDED